jgi:three-Cys-motif partner protein
MGNQCATPEARQRIVPGAEHEKGMGRAMRQQFGGQWTETKLQALTEYLAAYMTIMRGNQNARRFRTTYIDAFAGSGRWQTTETAGNHPVLTGLEEFAERDVVEFHKGSAWRALELAQPFDRYIFVDRDPHALAVLAELKSAFPQRNIETVCADANEFLPRFCESMQSHDRAVVFLDPFGMQTDWVTVEAIAATRKIDLWALIPLGQAIARMLPRREMPPGHWCDRLSRFLGDNEWRDRLYRTETQNTLFGEDKALIRNPMGAVQDLIVERWKAVFAGVLETPIVLQNTRGVPLYMLCFGVGNPRAVGPALNIANDLARKFNDGGQ